MGKSFIKKTACCFLVFFLISFVVLFIKSCLNNNGDEITVLAREEGSGTRGAFSKLFNLSKNGIDNTTDYAEVTNSTAVTIMSVIGNKRAIGYISLGAVNDDISVLKIDGAKASAENIKDNIYRISRPFNIVTRPDLSDYAKDFIGFIMSRQGQEIVKREKYVSVGSENDYTPGFYSDETLTITGSSSVAPLMEVLCEEYIKINPNAKIEIQQNDTSTGISSVIEDICDIGMASRDLNEKEAAKNINATVIALDGIALIVNKINPVYDLTSEQVRQIFGGEITSWSMLDE